ncbi:DUF3747 domain-containing protein [Okeania sp.]|uniref:DUF3747 domain-containing protein n=1 Tax=Okeania sp. TaxID=3100323 RepID=UPI002B4B01AA|nr:DUF3747 domain-containing protein [Okeania sp.]MEB3341718.1 DUF3747 domain-containing protein [Okeania sp.]
MKNFFKQSIVTLTTLGLLTLSSIVLAQGVRFDKKEVDQSRYIAIAIPRRSFPPQLVIIEQKTDERLCWSESGDRPTFVDLLLLNFNFTGICGRATDSNGYSIRMADTDLALDYGFSIENIGGDMELRGVPRGNPNGPKIAIGRTYGLANGPTKIILEPGWRFTKRTFQGKELGHIYMTTDWLPEELEYLKPKY